MLYWRRLCYSLKSCSGKAICVRCEGGCERPQALAFSTAANRILQLPGRCRQPPHLQDARPEAAWTFNELVYRLCVEVTFGHCVSISHPGPPTQSISTSHGPPGDEYPVESPGLQLGMVSDRASPWTSGQRRPTAAVQAAAGQGNPLLCRSLHQERSRACQNRPQEVPRHLRAAASRHHHPR